MLQPWNLSVTRTENRTCIRNFGLSRTLSINNYGASGPLYRSEMVTLIQKELGLQNRACFAIISPRRHRDRRRISRCLSAYLDVRAHQVYHKIRTCDVHVLLRSGCFDLFVKYFPWLFFFIDFLFILYIVGGSGQTALHCYPMEKPWYL